jgi:hypothetical protein
VERFRLGGLAGKPICQIGPLTNRPQRLGFLWLDPAFRLQAFLVSSIRATYVAHLVLLDMFKIWHTLKFIMLLIVHFSPFFCQLCANIPLSYGERSVFTPHTELTPSIWVLYEKPTVAQRVKKYSAFYGTGSFITEFTGARY